MGKATVTICVVPRERFSATRPSLESIYAETSYPFDLVYVDGGSPPHVQSYLEGAAARHGFELVRTEFVLAPNEARNIAMKQARTKYVVFIDNDVSVSPRWLERLVACAEETGASIVGPLYLIGAPGSDVIHMAGGDVWVEERDGRRLFFERHKHINKRIGEVELQREACGQVEFHCMLARRDLFEKTGPLDEQLLSCREHIDFCLTAQQAGGTVYFEPSSHVTYSAPPPFGPGDRSFYLLRWSREWNRRSLERFAEKWDLDEDEGHRALMSGWLDRHRQKAYKRFRKLDRLLEPVLTRRRARQRGNSGKSL